jgi:hypothetical protein
MIARIFPVLGVNLAFGGIVTLVFTRGVPRART